MKITSIWVKDFGPFQELKIDLLPGRVDDRADVVLITGPNGSGKTSLLMALSAAFGSSATQNPQSSADLGHRLRGTSRVSFQFDGDESGEIWFPANEGPFGFSAGYTKPDGMLGWKGGFGVYDSEGKLQIRLNPDPRSTRPSFLFDASRTTRAAGSLTIGGSTDHAIGRELTTRFSGSPETGAFERWVAETKTKHALALADADVENAKRYADSLLIIEGAIADLTGSSFALKVLREPELAVVATIAGVDVHLHELPDGLRSSLAWIGDLIRRLHLIANGSRVNPRETEFFCLIDEIDAHLHPGWQRSILHIAERMFPNAQLFVTTHSPYVIQSAVDACVVRLGPNGELLSVEGPQSGRSIRAVSEEILGVDKSYSIDMETRLTAFDELKAQVLLGEAPFDDLDAEANKLAAEGGDLDRAMRVSIEETKRKLSAR